MTTMSAAIDAATPERPLELTITRIIAAPRALVWKVWTDPAEARHWGPEGYTVEMVARDARIGGAWRARLTPHDGGTDLWQGGVFREVVEPERLVYTFAWDDDGPDGGEGTEMLLTVTFEEAGPGTTRLTLHQSGFPSLASRDGHHGGWSQAIDRMARHAEATATPSRQPTT